MSGDSGAKRDRYGLRLSGIPEYRDLSLRVRNRLASQGIETLEELLSKSAEELMRIPHFGDKCLSEVADFIKKVEKGIGLGPLRSPGVLDKIRGASLGFEGLDDLTRESLEEAGITDATTLFERSVSEILEALAYDSERLYALWTCCGLPRPADADELLAVLCMLNAPLRVPGLSQEEYMDSLGRCLELIREQVEEGTLHPQALMNYAPLQSRNVLLKPPAKDTVELLERAERGAVSIPLPVLDALEESLQTFTLADDLNLLLGTLDGRETLVLRRRYAPFEETLRSVADEIGVTRERIRQIQQSARTRLLDTYRNTLSLPRLRSAMLFVSQAEAYSAKAMKDVLCSRGISREDEDLEDFLAVWRALDDKGSIVADHLHIWRVLDRGAYRFPLEELRSVFSTGLTRAQTDLTERLMPLVRRRCSRSGFFSRIEVLRDVFCDDLPDDEDLRHVLDENDCIHVIGDYWTGPSGGRDVPENVFRKMLYHCGPLDGSAIQTGLARHQAREGYASPPLEVLEAMLGRRGYVEVLEDGRFALRPGEDAPVLGRMERTWLNLAEKHGPVLTHGQIVDEFRRKNLSQVGAAQLCKTSDLVVKLTRNRYSLPGRVPDSLAQVESPLLEVDGATPSAEYTGLDDVQARLVVGTEAPHSPRLHLPESRWPGKVAVVFDWQGEEFRVRTRYVVSEDVTIAGPQDFALKRPVWDRYGTLRSGDLFARVAVPPPPGSRSLVFLSGEGRRVKNWRGGREHLVFVHEDVFDADGAGLLFGDYRVVGSPPGWEEYRLLRAKIERVGDGATPETLDDAAREMGLPGFERLYRVRAKLLGTPAVGSGVPPGRVPEFEEYPVSRPPVLELYGLWHGAVRVDLYAVETSGVTGYVETKLDSLEVESNGHSRVVELLDRPGPGLYRVRVEGCGDMIFRTAPHSDGDADFAGLDLRLLAGSGGEDARLTVRAWSGAKFDLSVTCGVAWRRYATLRTDGSGLWEGTLSDLGVSGVPKEGRLEASISWRGLLTRRVVLRESCLGAGNRFEWSEVSGERVLALRVPEEGDALDALGDETYIIGERPWLGEVWEPVVRGVPGGGTSVVVPGAVGPAWSVEISDSEEPAEVTVNPVDGERSLAERWFGVGDVLGDEDPSGAERWLRVSGALRERSLSPSLRKRLGVGELRRTLSESIAEFPTAPRWLPLTPELQSRLHELSRYGLRTPVVAFVPGKEPEGEQGVKGLSSVLSAEISHLAETGESALLYLEGDGRLRKTTNRVLAPETVLDGRANYLIEAGEHLSACLGCGLYMPSRDFDYHAAVAAGKRTCGGSGRSFRMISPGVRRDVVLAVHLDPEQLPAVFEEIVHRAVAGEDIPDFAEPWMGRIVEVFNADAAETDEPERWFARARECLLGAGVLLERLGSGRIRETELADHGWSSVPYRGAMKVVSDWTRDEMEGR